MVQLARACAWGELMLKEESVASFMQLRRPGSPAKGGGRRTNESFSGPFPYRGGC